MSVPTRPYSYAKFFRVRQKFEAPRVTDIPATVQAELGRLGLERQVKPGQTVAITAGSRGIANIKIIIKAAVQFFQKLGAKPFIVPAMGSHGGGTAEGQRGIIEGYGITEEYCGCPIKASMETIVVCQTAEGFPVHFDKHASQADHVLVVGRVKPHTDFVGDVESGLMKMMLIGLGKHEGAKVYHRAILDYSFPQIVRSVAVNVLERCHILAGLAIVENGYDETAKIAAVGAAELEARERELLKLARQWMPKLPFQLVDILFIDELGKNISGAGVDTNVVGRKFQFHSAAEDEYPKVKRIVVRGLTEETHGNASGIGLVEFCTTRAMKQIDPVKTRINCLTSGNVAACMLPCDFETDREILDAALPTIGLTEPIDAKILWIRNTLSLAEVECSQKYWSEARERNDLEVLSDLRELPFDKAGNLPRLVDDLAVQAAVA
ncbi:MAG TPA: lactate racemase domain-containing protein [Pirellulales bacterium]|nr:lactate racemase domain-containing protein [Pirellulales bacterium]